MLVLLAEKEVKRQCSSKRFMKSKATAELSKQDREQQVQASKQASKMEKNMGPDHVSGQTLCKSI